MLKQHRVRQSGLIGLAVFQLMWGGAIEAMAATPQVVMAPERSVLLKADGSVWQWGVVDFVAVRPSPSSNCYADGLPKLPPAPVNGLADIAAEQCDSHLGAERQFLRP